MNLMALLRRVALSRWFVRPTLEARRDNQTGLMWEMKNATGKIVVSCVNATYNWTLSSRYANASFVQFLHPDGADYHDPAIRFPEAVQAEIAGSTVRRPA